MAKADHWLRAVEAVLRAQTSDLRTLARIAGADPATLFIGTPMDGADLRGQDLRGMRFTHLDPSRVRRDEQTQLDGHLATGDEASDGQDHPSPARALVLWISKHKSGDILRGRELLGKGVRVFTTEEYSEFTQESRRFEGPKLVVIDERSRRISGPLPSMGHETIVVFVRRANSEFFSGNEIRSLGLSKTSAVMIPISSITSATFPTTMTESINNFIYICCNNWPDIRNIIKGYGLSAFIYERGSNSDGNIDAWSRILSLAARSNVFGYDGLGLLHGPTNKWKGAEILFPRQAPVAIDMSGMRNPLSSAALILGLDGQRASPEAAYAKSVSRMLQYRGWILEEGHHAAEGLDFRASGSAMSIGIDVVASNAPQGVSRKIEDRALRGIEFSHIDRLIFDERANLADLMHNLISSHSLTVTIGDVQAFSADRLSIWPIIATQLRRVSRYYDAKSRTQYLSMFIIAALRNTRVQADRESYLRDALSEADFSTTYTLSSARVTSHEEGFGAVVTLSRNGRGSRHELTHLLTFRLLIDHIDGPFISEIGPPLTRRRPNARF